MPRPEKVEKVEKLAERFASASVAVFADFRGLTVKDATELFSLALDAKPGFRRAGLRARIDHLVDINRDLKAAGATLEHFYDY